MPYIGHSPTQAGSYIEVDDFGSSFNGSNVAFTLQVGGVSITPNQQNLLVMIDGVLQQPSDAFSVSGSTITFTEAPANGADLYCLLMGQSASIGNGTIGADELKISGDGTSGQLLKSDGDGTYSYLNQTSVTSGTATTLATARTINGVSFDGSANITVTADANTLSNTTLKSTVVNSSLTSVGTLTTLTVDNITIDGSEIDNSSGNLTLDSAGDIYLDAGGADIVLLDDGTHLGTIKLSSSALNFDSQVSDQDITFSGNDGGSAITALTLDMSEGGNATFAGEVLVDSYFSLRTTDDQANRWLLYTHTDDTFRINYNGSGGDELTMDTSGNTTFASTITQNGNYFTIDHSAQNGIKIKGNDTACLYIYDKADDSLSGGLTFSHDAAEFFVYTNGVSSNSEALKIVSNNDATFAGDVTINTSSHSTLLIKGALNCDAELALQSDNGDDNADYWSINAKHSTGGTLHFATYGSGAWTNPLILSHTSATFSGNIISSGNIEHDGTITTDITSNNTGHDFRLHADNNYVNSIDSFFDGASAGSSFMRIKVASGAGSQSTVMNMYGNGYVSHPNQPAFHAYGFSGNSHIYANSGDRDPIVYVNTDLNQGSHYSTSNGRFTAPVAGVYHFYMNVMYKHYDGDFAVFIKINGTTYTISNNHQEYNGSDLHTWVQTTTHLTIALSANDYVTTAFSSSLNTQTHLYGAGRYNSFGGHMVA